jgi:HD superfamily phosphodiesterase
MIYTIEDLGSHSLYIEKRTNEDNIIHGWATLTFTEVGCKYSDSSKVKKVLTNCAEIVNYFDNCTTKYDEVSDVKHADAECYDLKTFQNELFRLGWEKYDEVIEKVLPKIEDEYYELLNKIELLKTKKNDLYNLTKIW